MVETMCREVYLIWQKKNIENRDKSKITKHLIFPFFVKGRQFSFFTNLMNSKLISKLVLSDLSVFLNFLCNIFMTNFDKHNNFNMRMGNSKIQ